MVISVKPKLIILIGAPCTGKTTWAANMCNAHDDYVVIQKENLYKRLQGHSNLKPALIDIATSMIQSGIIVALNNQLNVIFDGMNTQKEDITQIIETFGDYADIYYKVFSPSKEELAYLMSWKISNGEDLDSEEINRHINYTNLLKRILHKLEIKEYTGGKILQLFR